MKKRNFVLVAMAFAVVADLAVAQTSDGMSGSGMGGMGGMSSTTMIPPELAANPAVLAYAAAMDKMMADMMVPYTGDPDIDFARGMIPHHQAAIDMAKIQLEFGKDPEMRKLAEAIIAAQESEIATLKAFLATKGM